jgi:putative DNA primase/helicase
MNLRSIAHALGGEVSSGQVLAPGPGHSKRDRSLSVRLSPGAPAGFLAFSHAGDYVRQRLGVVTTTERQNFAASRNFKPASTPSPENRTRDAARRLFVEAIDPRETIGEHYLKIERRLGDVLDDVLALTLRRRQYRRNARTLERWSRRAGNR